MKTRTPHEKRNATPSGTVSRGRHATGLYLGSRARIRQIFALTPKSGDFINSEACSRTFPFAIAVAAFGHRLSCSRAMSAFPWMYKSGSLPWYISGVSYVSFVVNHRNSDTRRAQAFKAKMASAANSWCAAFQSVTHAEQWISNAEDPRS